MRNIGKGKLGIIALLALGSSYSTTALAELGDANQDLVYSPVTPCRIFDTRTSQGGSGAIAGGSTKHFFVYGNGAAIGGQGGNAVGCGAPKGEPVAAHINFTVVPSVGNGHIKVYPKDSPSTSSTVNFKQGVNLANAITVKTLFDIGDADITVEAAQTVDVLADVLGYYYAAEQKWAYDGYDIFGTGSSQLIDSNIAKNVTPVDTRTPQMTTKLGDNIYFSATVAINPASNGNVEVNMYGCRLANGTAAPIVLSYNNIEQELAACYANLSTSDYIIVPVSGVMNNVPAGTWEFSICADNAAFVPCSSPQPYRTHLQQMTIINLGN